MNNKLENTESNRANEVAQELSKITNQTKTNFFTLGALLLEFDEGNYYQYFGSKNFTEWVEQSELELSPRQAYYFLSIAKKTRELGLNKDDLSEISISSLKEILSLEPSKHEENIRGLLKEADSLSVDEVKQRVRSLKQKNGDDIYCHLNFKLTEEVKEIVEEALELARRLNGSTVDTNTGEVVDISNSRCLEFIAASFLQDPNNQNQPKVEVLL